MRRKSRSPWVSLALFLIVCSMGWVTWEYRHELRWEREHRPTDTVLRDRVESIVVEEFEHEMCFLDIRGHLNWRPNEGRYRLDLLLDGTTECEGQAGGICERIAKRIAEETESKATVVAFDPAGRELGRCVL
jgi:hypothetical protein